MGSGLRAAGVERTRRAIVAAARRRLIETGYHGLSLEQVADEAGVTRVTIYRRFGSKLGLLDAVADDLAERSGLVPRLRTAAATADASAAFRAMVRELCRFWATDPDLLRRLVSLAAVDPAAGHLIADRERWRHDQVAGFVGRLKLRPPYDAESATAVVAAVTGFPACDDMATRLGRDLAGLDDLLIPLLAGVVRLTPG